MFTIAMCGNTYDFSKTDKVCLEATKEAFLNIHRTLSCHCTSCFASAVRERVLDAVKQDTDLDAKLHVIAQALAGWLLRSEHAVEDGGVYNFPEFFHIESDANLVKTKPLYATLKGVDAKFSFPRRNDDEFLTIMDNKEKQGDYFNPFTNPSEVAAMLDELRTKMREAAKINSDSKQLDNTDYKLGTLLYAIAKGTGVLNEDTQTFCLDEAFHKRDFVLQPRPETSH